MVGGTAVASICNTVIKVETELGLQCCQNEAKEGITVTVHLCRLEGDEAHANHKIICDTASHNVDGLTEASGAVENHRKMLLEKLLHNTLDLPAFNLRDIQLRHMCGCSERVTLTLQKVTEHVNFSHGDPRVQHGLRHPPTVHMHIRSDGGHLCIGVLGEMLRNQDANLVVFGEGRNILVHIVLVVVGFDVHSNGGFAKRQLLRACQTKQLATVRFEGLIRELTNTDRRLDFWLLGLTLRHVTSA
eukprot:4775142-Prymnesium_polylepis.1